MVVCVLRYRESDSGGSVEIQLYEERGPFRWDSQSGPGHLESGLADAVKCSSNVPGGDESRGMSFFGVFEGIHQEEGGTVCAMFSTESMLRRVQHVVGLPGSAYAVREDAGP